LVFSKHSAPAAPVILAGMRALPGGDKRAQKGRGPATKDSVKTEQRQRILRAAGVLIADGTYGSVTVEEIIKEAHVGFKTFYDLFPNKEQVFLDLFDEVIGELGERIDAALAEDKGAPWAQQVSAALRAFFEVLIDDPLIARATIFEAPAVGPVIIERYEQAAKQLVPLLRLGRAEHQGELPETLEDTLTGGMLWSAYQQLLVAKPKKVEALLPGAVEFVLRPYLGEAEAGRWAAWSAEPAAEKVPSA
jgi:AcrR family transcriptional regulator